MGQKVTTTLVDKNVIDASRYKLLLFVLKLVHPNKYMMHEMEWFD